MLGAAGACSARATRRRLSTGTTTRTLAGVASTIAVGVPGVLSGGAVSPVGVASSTAVGTPGVARGAVVIPLTGVPSGASPGTPSLGFQLNDSAGNLLVDAAGNNLSTGGIGSAQLAPAGVASGVSVGDPTVTSSLPSTSYGGGATKAGNVGAAPNSWAPSSLFLPTTGDIALVLFYRANQATDPNLSLALPSGGTIVRQLYLYGGAGGRASLAIWTARTVTTGTGLTPTISSSVANWGCGNLFAFNLVNWTGNFRCPTTARESFNGTTTTTRTASTTMGSAGGALIGGGQIVAVAAVNNWSTGSAGWTEAAELTVGAVDGSSSSSSALYRKGGGVLGAAESLALTSVKSWTDWSDLIAEFW